MEQRQGRIKPRVTWLDRAIGFLSPQTGLKRLRSRVAADLLERHYEGAASGRRTQGWNRSTGDANMADGPALTRLRDTARDLVRNNPNAKSAVRTIANHVVGWGIVAKPNPTNQKAADLWQQWAETTACDSDGQNDFYGLEKLVTRTVVESGEVLVRRRIRRPEDGLPIPMQLQVLDPDYLDTAKNGPIGTGHIIHGVEFDALGKRAFYWLFREHPGSQEFTMSPSVRVPAESVRHIYRKERPGQVRGPSWFAPVLLRFKDFDEYEDATLVKQKIAACLAVITSNKDSGLGTTDGGDPAIDSLEPGMILGVADGQTVQVVEPPSVREYSDYTKTSLRAIATGLGVTYEDLTGDYSDMPFSAARMSRLSHWDRVEDWRWQMLIPQFCDPAWAWAMQVASVVGLIREAPVAEWTPPPAPMIDPQNEGLAITRNIRGGIQTLSGALRERGYIPEDFLAEMAADNKRLDELKIVLDSDARKITQAGQLQMQPAAKPPAANGAGGVGEDEEEEGAAAARPPAKPPNGEARP